jgi:hypothetical protein
MTDNATFCVLVQRCGLHPMFARNAMARAVERAGLVQHEITALDLPRLLPHVERVIRPFLDACEVSRALARLCASA